jgi:hypothetical protein
VYVAGAGGVGTVACEATDVGWTVVLLPEHETAIKM